MTIFRRWLKELRDHADHRYSRRLHTNQVIQQAHSSFVLFCFFTKKTLIFGQHRHHACRQQGYFANLKSPNPLIPPSRRISLVILERLETSSRRADRRGSLQSHSLKTLKGFRFFHTPRVSIAHTPSSPHPHRMLTHVAGKSLCREKWGGQCLISLASRCAILNTFAVIFHRNLGLRFN